MALNNFGLDELTTDPNSQPVRRSRSAMVYSGAAIVFLLLTATSVWLWLGKQEQARAAAAVVQERAKALDLSIQVVEQITEAPMDSTEDWRATQSEVFGNYVIQTETLFDGNQNQLTRQSLLLNNVNLLPERYVDIISRVIDVDGDGKPDLVMAACAIDQFPKVCDFVIADRNSDLPLRLQPGYIANSTGYDNERLKIKIQYALPMFEFESRIKGPVFNLHLLHDGTRFTLDEAEQLRKSPSVEDFEFCSQTLRDALARYWAAEDTPLSRIQAGEVLWRFVGTMLHNGNPNIAFDYLRNNTTLKETPFLLEQQAIFMRTFNESDWNIDVQYIAKNIKSERKSEDYQAICKNTKRSDARVKKL